MSSTFSRESAASPSGLNEPECEPSRSARSNPSAGRPRKALAQVPMLRRRANLTADRISADGITVDVICGGFPCQDISTAGGGAGIEGERSGLWSEYARIIGELRPKFVIVENVSALLGRGLDRVLGDLAEIGYDAEWHCIPASALGAPHRRDRIWIVAHPAGLFGNGRDHNGQRNSKGAAAIPEPRDRSDYEDLADANSLNVQGVFAGLIDEEIRSGSVWGQAGPRSDGLGWWSSEPDVGRVAYGIPARVDRLKSLGNAVVPQIPEIIGRAIMRASTVTSQEQKTP
jgi:DNA (cytosine-5)-methyltransferase 1